MRLKVKKILVPTDFSDLSLSTVKYAASIARYTEAEIILLHVIEAYEHIALLNKVIDVNKTVQRAVNKKLLEIQKENIELWNVKITAKIVNGKIHDQIEKIISKMKIDLVVMGTHGASNIGNLEKFILGSNAYRTVHISKCPVITMRKAKAKPAFKKILLPLDTTKETKQKVDTAIAIARLFNSTIHVVSVSTFLEEFQYNLKELNQQVKEVADKIAAEKIDVKTKMIRHEDVGTAVLDYAKAIDADLILIMVRAEGRLNEYILGSRASKVITNAQCPVMSIRPK